MRIMTQNKPEAYRIFILILYRFAWPSRKIADPPKKKISFIFVKKIEKNKNKNNFTSKRPIFLVVSFLFFVFLTEGSSYPLLSLFSVYGQHSQLLRQTASAFNFFWPKSLFFFDSWVSGPQLRKMKTIWINIFLYISKKMMDPLYFFWLLFCQKKNVHYVPFFVFQLKQQQQQHIPNRSITAFALHLTTYFNLFVFCYVSFVC